MSDVVGRYRRAYPRIFRHPGFKGLTATEQLLTLYLLSGPQSNRIGLFYLSVNTAAEDLEVGADTIRKGIRNISDTFGWHFDSVARVFYISSWWRWNNPGSPKVLEGNLKDLSEIPPCALVDAFARNTEYLGDKLLDTFTHTVAIRIPKGTPTQEQYQEQKQKQDQERALRATAKDKSEEAYREKPKALSSTNGSDLDDRVIRAASDVAKNFSNFDEPSQISALRSLIPGIRDNDAKRALMQVRRLS
jgi:hypothetical protein